MLTLDLITMRPLLNESRSGLRFLGFPSPESFGPDKNKNCLDGLLVRPQRVAWTAHRKDNVDDLDQ
jgi:hypothetical protein